jgi:hypothetical protein
MAFQDFLGAFAEVQGISSVDSLLNDYAKRYSFQINSRDRARDAIEKLESLLNLDWTPMATQTPPLMATSNSPT